MFKQQLTKIKSSVKKTITKIKATIMIYRMRKVSKKVIDQIKVKKNKLEFDKLVEKYDRLRLTYIGYYELTTEQLAALEHIWQKDKTRWEKGFNTPKDHLVFEGIFNLIEDRG